MQYCIYLARIELSTFSTDYMSHEDNTFSSKTTFTWVQFQMYFPESGEHHSQVLKMVLPLLIVDIEVIHKYFQEFVS
jgi:hypothetical protein